MGAVRRGEESTIKCLTEARESSEDLGGLLAITRWVVGVVRDRWTGNLEQLSL